MKPQLRSFIFWCTSLILLTTYALLIPPFQFPDEPHHLIRAYQASEGYGRGVRTENRLGAEVPTSLVAFADDYRALRFDPSAKNTPELRQRNAERLLRPTETTFADIPNTGLYPPTVYLPHLPALWLGRWLEWRPYTLLYATRIACGIFWLLGVALILKILPFARDWYAWLMLLPSSLAVHAGAGGDAVTNLAAGLLLAMLLRLIYHSPRVAPRHLWSMAGLTVLIALNRFVYLPVLGLILLIPAQKWGSTRRRWTHTTILLAGSLLLLAWKYVTAGDLFVPYDRYHPDFRDGITLNSGVDPSAQLRWILAHPLSFLKIWIRTLAEGIPSLTAHYFGKFGWGKNYLPFPLVGFLALGTLYFSLRREGPEVTTRQRLWVLLLTGIMALGLAITIYMMWSPVGLDRIRSLGGRYYFAIFPLLFFALKIPRKLPDLRPWCWLGLLLVHAWTLWEIWVRYYGV